MANSPWAVVNLLCILCSRIRTYRELLMIFFHDKHWYHSEPLFSVEEEEEEEEEEESVDDEAGQEDPDTTIRGNRVTLDQEIQPPASPTFSPPTLASEKPPEAKKPEYEFLLFNYLLRFVHREGHIGEFARAGLLFLMDVAMSPGETDNHTESSEASSDPVNDAALALAEYILDGDFSEVLGAGLGAVYSLLPSKLGFFPQTSTTVPDNNGMTIGGPSLADEEEQENVSSLRERSRSMGIEDARSSEFKVKIDHFLTLLVFLQDVLRRNNSQENVDASALVGTAIVQSILDAVRRIFLENVLYPSILECSDVDGSAVAVMSYIEIMVRTLREGPLANLLVNFLVSEDNDDSRFRQRTKALVTLGDQDYPPVSSDEKKKSRRRQSSAMTLLEMEAPESRKPSDYFTSMGRFTLKDLLLSNLKSKSQPTATSALQLLKTMLTFHPGLTTERILLVIPDPFATSFPHPAILGRPHSQGLNLTTPNDDDEDEEFLYPDTENSRERFYPEQPVFIQPETTYSTHEREMDLYLTLITRLDRSHHDDSDNFSTGYDHYLHDALVSIQSQPSYWRALEDSEEVTSRSKHRLNVNDPILSLVLESLTTLFSNTPDFNIGLTGVLATLAMHPDRSMGGWITFATSEDPGPLSEAGFGIRTADDDGDDRSIDFSIEEKLASDTNFLPAASMDERSRPVVYSLFQALVNQLERYRHSIENFDKFLLERRQGLLFSENLNDALNLSLELSDEPQATKPIPEFQSPKPKSKPSASSSFVSFLTPRKNKPTRPPPPPEPTTPSRERIPKNVSASPFGRHYQRTGSVKVEPVLISVSPSGPWTPSRSRKWTAEEEDVFAAGWTEKSLREEQEDEVVDSRKLSPITLSQLLDNVVILEESIKEVVAIIHARRSLGIDSVRYL